MDFHCLDSNHFKAFWYAADTLNFSKASELAHMTQSGISQHVMKLEDQLQSKLFLRVGKKVVLTPSGENLKNFIESYVDQVKKLKSNLKKESEQKSGSVSYAMPESCLFSNHLGLLANKIKQENYDIQLDIEICSSNVVLEKILNLSVQFGFSTHKKEIAGLKFEPFCKEEYALLSESPLNPNYQNLENLKNLPFIFYPGFVDIFESFKKECFPNNKVNLGQLRKVATVSHLKGLISLIASGNGVALAPVHIAQDYIDAGRIYTNHLKSDVFNQIYLVTLSDQPLSQCSKVVIRHFFELSK